MPKRTKPPPPAITAPGGAMPHADSPTVVADSAEFRAISGGDWRCPHDGQPNITTRCTTCGTEKA